MDEALLSRVEDAGLNASAPPQQRWLDGWLLGLYDIHTHPQSRQQGLARNICERLLTLSGPEGASTAYLQVDAGNELARRLYGRLGFLDAYAHHYRRPPASSPGGVLSTAS